MQKNSDKISKGPIAVATGFHMEVYKTALGFSLSVSGVEGIMAFSDTEIIVKLSAFSLRILSAIKKPPRRPIIHKSTRFFK